MEKIENSEYSQYVKVERTEEDKVVTWNEIMPTKLKEEKHSVIGNNLNAAIRTFRRHCNYDRTTTHGY